MSARRFPVGRSWPLESDRTAGQSVELGLTRESSDGVLEECAVLPVETAAVNRARPQPTERLDVLRRRVALVPGQAVARIGAVQFNHQPVAVLFGEDRRGGDRWAKRVAAHHRQVWPAKAGYGQAVN